jgi:hypothetical protein
MSGFRSNGAGNNTRSTGARTSAGAAGGSKMAGAAKQKGEWISLETYGAKVPEELKSNYIKDDGQPVKFFTIAEKSQHTNSEYPNLSINYNRLVQLVEEGVLTVNDKGYISGVNVFAPLAGK